MRLSATYWSSSEHSSGNAWYFGSSGYPNELYFLVKSTTGYVRAIRAF
jgi:hypothetical protein